MDDSAAIHEELITQQRQLLIQIRKSHRLFLLRFYSILAVSILFIFFMVAYVILGDLNSLLSIVAFQLIPIIFLFKSIRENLSFVRWSRHYLRNIEESGKYTPILSGLTTYINRLYRAVFLDLEFPAKTPQFTWSQFLKEVNRKARIKYILLGVILLLSVFFFYQFYLLNPEKPDFGTYPLVMITIVFLALLMIILQIQWVRSVNVWAKGFQALETWGEELARAFHQTENGSSDQEEDLSGR